MYRCHQVAVLPVSYRYYRWVLSYKGKEFPVVERGSYRWGTDGIPVAKTVPNGMTGGTTSGSAAVGKQW